MTHKTQPTAHAEITAPISADLRRMNNGAQPEALTAAASRLANVADQVRALEPEGGESDVYLAEASKVLRECAGRIAELEALQAAPPAPAVVSAPVADDAARFKAQHDFLKWNRAQQDPLVKAAREYGVFNKAVELYRDALAAAPAHASAGITIDFKQATELLAMFGGEPAEVTLIEGPGHSGEGLYAYYSDLPEEGAEFLGKPDNEAVPATPAQEHATQLAGQGREKCVCTFAQRVVGDGCRDCNPQEYIDRMHKCLDDYREEADTPAQAQEGARDLEAEALRACRDLPEGWEIVIHLEKGCGGVVLIDPEDNENDLPVDGMLFDALKESIDQAVQADAARAAQGGAA